MSHRRLLCVVWYGGTLGRTRHVSHMQPGPTTLILNKQKRDMARTQRVHHGYLRDIYASTTAEKWDQISR